MLLKGVAYCHENSIVHRVRVKGFQLGIYLWGQGEAGQGKFLTSLKSNLTKSIHDYDGYII